MYRSQRESLEKELSELNDEELVKRCVETMSPDSIAYQILINRYQRIIRGTCMNILMNEEDAEEVAQDTYIRLYFKLHQFQGRSTFKTWLYRIVRNYCNNNITKQIRHREKNNVFKENTILEPNIYDEKETEERLEIVWITLDKLKENDREVLVLKFFSGMTIDEISNTLQIGLSATKMRLYRAMSAFKEAYGTVELDNSMLMKRNMFSVRKMSKPLGSMQR